MTGGARKPKIDTRTEIERLADLARVRAANEIASEPLVPIHAQRHGAYEHDVEYGSQRGRMVNRGGTPIARWKRAGLLSETQQAAIAHCVRLWDAVGSSKGMSANLDRIVFGSAGDGMQQQEALDDLHRIKGYFPATYWDVFENVARFDEPAGTAGSRLERPAHARELAAQLCVCMVADIIYMRERLSY